MPEVGIFAQRAKDRPNPLGTTAVRLVAVAEDAATVQGLDAIDGTPVLDLMPYYRAYDLVAEASVPEWVDRLMTGYFQPDRSMTVLGCHRRLCDAAVWKQPPLPPNENANSR